MAHQYLSSQIGSLKYAYSLKKVVSGYSGSCIRVREDSGDTEQDIGFSGDDLDTASLVTFLNGANGYVVTWYDQTGTVNLVQATAAHQPQIIQDENSEWVVNFDGSSENIMLENGDTLTTATNSILHCVWKAYLETDEVAGVQFGSTAQQFQPWADKGNSPYIRTAGPATLETDALWDDSQWRCHNVCFFNGSLSAYEQGTKMVTSSSRTNPDMAHLYVGGNDVNYGYFAIKELVWFDAVKEPRDIWEVTKNNFASNFTYDDIILHIGDSLSTGVICGNGNAYATKLHTSLGTPNWFTRAKAGDPTSEWINKIAILGYFGQGRFLGGTNKTAIVWIGTNDITAGATGEVAYARFQNLCYNLKAYGFGSIIALTCLPRTQTGVTGVTFADERDVFNNLLRADTTIDLLVDLDDGPAALLDFTDSENYYVGDGIHLNEAGNIVVAGLIESAMDTNGFNFSSQGVGNMGAVFALRGDTLNARYSTEGKEPALLGAEPAAVTTDHAGINGSTSLDFAGSGVGFRPAIYVGRSNTPAGKPRSVLIRVLFGSFASSNGLFNILGSPAINNMINGIGAYITTGGEVTVYVSNNLAQTDSGVTSGASLTNVVTNGGSAVFHDIVVTWTGDTTANGLEIWIDGTRVLQDTMTRALPTYDENQQDSCSQIVLGAGYSVNTVYSFIDEVVFWDEVIDPTSVTLTSGSGSLNGASRTAYVDVAAYDGVQAAIDANAGSGLKYCIGD